MKLLTKNLQYLNFGNPIFLHFTKDDTRLKGGKKCMHKFRVDLLGGLVKETLHIVFKKKGFRVLGFGPLNARLARIEGMMGYLNRW